jgi:hypothetical protein
MVKTRIACYFDVPRGDNNEDYHNFVDVSVCGVVLLARGTNTTPDSVNRASRDPKKLLDSSVDLSSRWTASLTTL